MSCGFARLDGSYVLGALSPAERRQFEEHLTGCAECARSVRDLAGLPGLLARVEPGVLAAPPVGDPLPATLLPALVDDVRRDRRRRALLTAGLAAAAAVLVCLGSLAAAGTFDEDPLVTAARTPAATVPAGEAMAQVGQVPVSAHLALTGVLWGTRLDLTCSYPGGGEYGTPPPRTYAMFVRTRDGRVQRVATWRALPGRTMRLAAATAAARGDITSVEVRTSDGKPVLKLVA